MPESVAPMDRSLENQTLDWLALSFTPGLGPTRARRLAERFGNVRGVFLATLTELEAAGIQAVSAQALATGQSMELAQEEMNKANAAGIRIVCCEDPQYPTKLRQIYDPLCCCMCAEISPRCRCRELL